MPITPDMTEIRKRLRQVLEGLPQEISMKDLSVATSGNVSPQQLSAFKTSGYLGDEGVRLLEMALERLVPGLWPPRDLMG